MDSKISVAIISVLVASMVLVAGLPLISGIMSDTVTVTNEGAGDLRFNLVDSHVSYTVSIAQNLDNTGIDITNGSDVQTLLYDDASIIYADDNIAIWYDANDLKIIGPNNGVYMSGEINDVVTVSRTVSGVDVAIGDPAEVLTFPAPTWAYVANSTGKYGYFENGTEITVPTGTPLATVGSYAGVDCYNSHNNYDLPLALDLTQTDNKLSGAKWIKAVAEQVEPDIIPLDPGSITINPLDPGILDPEPDADLMTVPTPSYTDGDWGYNLKTVNGVQKAVIVSYSGADGGVLTVPSTVGGYDVVEVGKGGAYETIVPTNFEFTGFVVPEGVTKIGSYCLASCNKFTGNLILPSTLETISGNAFYNTKFTGNLTLPNGLKIIANNAFQYCSGFTGGLIIPDTVTRIDFNAFSSCSGLNGKLVLSSSLNKIDDYVFSDCKFTGVLIIPSSIQNIYDYAFDMNNFEGLVLLSDNLTVSSNGFSRMGTVSEVLKLGSAEITTTTGGLNADEISDNVPAMGYLSAVEYTERSTHTGPTYDLIAILPLVLSAGLVLFCIAVLIRRV